MKNKIINFNFMKFILEEQIKKVVLLILFNARELFFKIRFIFGYLKISILKLLKVKFLSTYKKPIPKEKIKKILIFRPDRIGDLILTTPAIKILKENFKNSQIDIVVNSYTKPIVENNPFIKNIFCIDEYKRKEFIKIIKKENYDLAVIFFSNIKYKKLAFKARIPYRIGSNRDGGGYLLSHFIEDTRKYLRHEVLACLDILKILNIKINKNEELFLKPDKKYKRKVLDFMKKNNLTNKRFITIHPYSRDPNMRWPENYYKELIKKILNFKKFKIVIIGSKNEKILVEKLIKDIKPSPINASGEFSLGELIYFLQFSKLFIGNSTGPVHIANALKVPVIVMFGSHYVRHHPKRWYPWNPGGFYFVPTKICKLCFPWACKLECMKTITPEMVYKKVEKFLK